MVVAAGLEPATSRIEAIPYDRYNRQLPAIPTHTSESLTRVWVLWGVVYSYNRTKTGQIPWSTTNGSQSFNRYGSLFRPGCSELIELPSGQTSRGEAFSDSRHVRFSIRRLDHAFPAPPARTVTIRTDFLWYLPVAKRRPNFRAFFAS